MGMHHLRMLVGDDLDAVNTLIFEKIQSEISLIDDLANHIVKSGGKRLRPLLVLLASRACDYSGEHHIRLAAMIEFFHTATLLHDDVIDESTLRRGQETANEIWGSKASILVGDYLLTQYMELMLDVGDLTIMRLLTDIAHQIGCGEIKQLLNRNNPALTEEEYFDVIRSKTSLLFAASASLGALVSKANATVNDGLYQYGLHLGNAFQLIDDALDYCSDAKTLGKNIGDDLADGKATLPLLHVLKHGNQEQQEQVKKSLKEGTLEYLPEIQKAITATKAIDYTRQVAASEVDKAISALQILPDSVYKDALVDLAKYATERDH
ncbi:MULTISPECIES: polyprenyl synthetase family protein [Legionella]|uniref:Octaprenyl diphosphate synthase n=1 Tax=Legionella septentrionalis TaxID=2498109 RepID=A0A3S0X0Z6_9GAMM|nr:MULTISPECIES: polyprenyl synthetase family protein [Legionella]MCP0914265.1 polyprenyl synthetase family protein [Legionella sp. 27cVA30]RUQ89200.1 octaprenyl diphosphate synthase [Legionella septentrionalis]RUR00600.1 octaprenyl diphosphate synthase [Legionella septentrionalis]RUR11767.1 octaprenyl diphosphate synthase [Legionella septentrionalis]RUR17455.1 octaprenyl diphosphate synthase [Legionella septentrionalis]